MLKILLIHNKYGAFSGEEAVVESQTKLLESNGHQVINYFRSSEELEEMKFGKIKAFFLAFYNPKTIKELKAIIQKDKPDIVHIHNLYPLISPAILPAVKKMGIPIIMTLHNYRLLCPNGLFFNKGSICEKCTGSTKELNCITNNCESSFFKSTGYAMRNFWARTNQYYKENVDLFLCLTSFQKRKLVANGFSSEKCAVLSNFYNNKLNEESIKIIDKNYVAFVGRISPEKGIPLLLEAAEKLPHIPFQLAGSILEGYKKELKIPKNVTFKGLLDQDELSRFYDNARFLVFSSICYEGFPMVFPEAMSHKLAIISPNMAGYPEIVQDGINGLLFETGNSSSLASKIEKLWNNCELSKKMGEVGFEITKKKYSAEVYYNQLINNYRKLISNHHSFKL